MGRFIFMRVSRVFPFFHHLHIIITFITSFTFSSVVRRMRVLRMRQGGHQSDEYGNWRFRYLDAAAIFLNSLVRAEPLLLRADSSIRFSAEWTIALVLCTGREFFPPPDIHQQDASFCFSIAAHGNKQRRVAAI